MTLNIKLNKLSKSINHLKLHKSTTLWHRYKSTTINSKNLKLYIKKILNNSLSNNNSLIKKSHNYNKLNSIINKNYSSIKMFYNNCKINLIYSHKDPLKNYLISYSSKMIFIKIESKNYNKWLLSLDHSISLKSLKTHKKACN